SRPSSAPNSKKARARNGRWRRSGWGPEAHPRATTWCRCGADASPFSSPHSSLDGRLHGFSERRFVFLVRVQAQMAEAILTRGVHRRAPGRGRAPFAVHRILPRGKRDVAAAMLAFPDAESDELQPVERAGGEVKFRVGKLARRVAFVVRKEFD